MFYLLSIHVLNCTVMLCHLILFPVTWFFFQSLKSRGRSSLSKGSMLGTVAYSSRPRVQIYSFAYTSRSIHHSHYSHFLLVYYLVLTPVISLLTKPTPQGSYWLVYCSFVPQHVFLSFLAARSSFSFSQLAARARARYSFCL